MTSLTEKLEQIISEEYLSDNDGDGLLNFTEDDLGTNRDSPDTDGDGVSDALEGFYYFTYPLSPSNILNTESEIPTQNGIASSSNEHGTTVIMVDGYSDDWINVPITKEDPAFDFGGFEYEDADIQHLKTVILDGVLYIYIDFYE